jgi:hypothetical protein
MGKTVLIDPLSTRSLRIQTSVGTKPLTSATGFIVEKGPEKFLITNWHILSGRDPDTGAPESPTAGIPDAVHIVHHVKGQLGAWVALSEPLHENGSPRWREHPQGANVDVVALPLRNIPGHIEIYALDLSLADVDVQPQPTMPVAIIGFPFGITAGGAWPIWKTGHIATDPDIDYQFGRPAFLIDATTRSGMSGSPVVIRVSGGYTDSKGNTVLGAGVRTKFLGIYSGRIHGEAEIGRVWRSSVLQEIIK